MLSALRRTIRPPGMWNTIRTNSSPISAPASPSPVLSTPSAPTARAKVAWPWTRRRARHCRRASCARPNAPRTRSSSCTSRGAEALTLARAGLPLDPYFSASKLGWIVRDVPAAADALGKGRLRLGTTDAYFLDCLTGRFVTDPTTASRTSLLNLETGTWDDDL